MPTQTARTDLTVPEPTSGVWFVITRQAWGDTPLNVRYAELTLKEKLAINKMEAIPVILAEAKQPAFKVPLSTTADFSPARPPLIDRMAITFSRAMDQARAQLAADAHMAATMPDGVSIRPEEVMSVAEVDEFVVNSDIEAFHDAGKTIWLRQYYRTVPRGTGAGQSVAGEHGGLREVLPSFILPSIEYQMGTSKKEGASDDDDDGGLRVIIADVQLDGEG